MRLWKPKIRLSDSWRIEDSVSNKPGNSGFKIKAMLSGVSEVKISIDTVLTVLTLLNEKFGNKTSVANIPEIEPSIIKKYEIKILIIKFEQI